MPGLSKAVRQRKTALTVADVAEILSVSPRQIYKLVEEQKIPSFRVGKAVRFDPETFADWLRLEMNFPQFPELKVKPGVEQKLFAKLT